jgi:hypothetical protein
MNTEYKRPEWMNISEEKKFELILRSQGWTVEEYTKWYQYWTVRSRLSQLTFEQKLILAEYGHIADSEVIRTIAELTDAELLALVEDFEAEFEAGRWDGHSCWALMYRVYGPHATSGFYVPHAILSEEQRIQQVIRWSAVLGMPTATSNTVTYHPPVNTRGYYRRNLPQDSLPDSPRSGASSRSDSPPLIVDFTGDEKEEEEMDELAQMMGTMAC